MTKQEFQRLIDTVRMYYPEKNIVPSREVFEEWYKHFQKPLCTLDLMTRAVRRYSEKNKFPPTLSDLIQTGKEIWQEEKDEREFKRWRE